MVHVADEYKGSFEDTNQPDQGEPDPLLADSRNALAATEELLATAA